ncbi:MAG TPA: hypothetical protein VK518_16335 [Puia sp.]|nr:hypothetical protein [Puia sp.]
MKKIQLSIVFLLLLCQAFSQGNDSARYIHYRYPYGSRQGRQWSDTVLVIPKDTIWSKDGLALKNGILYAGDHVRWNAVGAGGVSGGFSLRTITSANFTSATDCPLPALLGDSLQVFWNDLGRFLDQGTEWVYLAGGGFRILQPDFDATTANFSFKVYSNSGSKSPGPLAITSANFTSSVNCPLPDFNGMQLQIFWNDVPRYLTKDVEWIPLAGGGFTITMPDFDATVNSYSFYIFNQ